MQYNTFLAVVLLTVGIPHGAMDHVIDGAVNHWKPDSFNSRFYGMYLGLMAVYSVVWYFSTIFYGHLPINYLLSLWASRHPAV
jgi:hypothetical protein